MRLYKRYADRLSDFIFIPRFWILYDVAALILLGNGLVLLVKHNVTWQEWVGFWSVCAGLLIGLGNRHRWGRLKKAFRARRRARA